ncbi:hypothetical protein CYMTET_12861 [Cymbomonas tetramitiformis]|uniref:Nucleotide-diphospho-sugar transferase domain-containing protein n=1 Tax=Cymbomonas tetramitiformis TaxID=36881 RepID=A0AAE0LBF0_9CHLO|nr:hypothetical protein CYMTET_12861 [Cymbomonas tetramitiformis]|eukprot:gene4424-5433_t
MRCAFPSGRALFVCAPLHVFAQLAAFVGCVTEPYIPSLISNAGATQPIRRVVYQSGISTELVNSVAVDNAIIVTWANAEYIDFVDNFVRHMQRLKLTNFLVGAMDTKVLAWLEKQQQPHWNMGTKYAARSTEKPASTWGSKSFLSLGHDKTRLIRDLALTGVDFVVTDIDVVWMRNPFPYFKLFPTADILVSTDQLQNQTISDDLERHICAAPSNIGIIFFRSSRGSRDFTQAWLDAVEKDREVWDQISFNDLKMRGNACAGKLEPSGLMRAFSDRVSFGVLPVTLFGNGHTFFVQRLHERLGDRSLEPYAAHTTFQFGGVPGKRQRLREAGLWLGDPAAYFSHSGGYLTYTPHIPADTDLDKFARRGYPVPEHTLSKLQPYSRLVTLHQQLVNFQLQQLRDALALAWALGRVLIVPPMLCGLDRVTGPQAGRWPGSLLKLPYVCPLDSVLNLQYIASKFNGSLPFREYSLLTNLAFRLAAKEHIRVGVDGAQTSVRGFPVSAGRILHDFVEPHEFSASRPRVKAGSSDKEIANALEQVKGAKLLHFDTLVDTFVGFAERDGLLGFKSALQIDEYFGYTWCCTSRHMGPGGVAKYDLLGAWAHSASWHCRGGDLDCFERFTNLYS